MNANPYDDYNPEDDAPDGPYNGLRVGDTVKVSSFDGDPDPYTATIYAIYDDGTATVKSDVTGNHNYVFISDLSLIDDAPDGPFNDEAEVTDGEPSDGDFGPDPDYDLFYNPLNAVMMGYEDYPLWGDQDDEQ